MIFRPVHPHILCCGYVNWQGVFLKRQAQVSAELTSMICEHLIYARRMLEFVIQSPSFQDILGIYEKHMSLAIDQAMGQAKRVAPMVIGTGTVENLKAEIAQETLLELP